jgi:hypothetical protein
MTNSETILSASSHVGDSSTQTATGDKYKGDGYYSRADGFHTVQYNLANEFRGRVVIQATLATTPVEADWFDVADTENTYTGSTGSFMYNFTGNYVWVRAYVDTWTAGTINSITLNH